MFASSRAADREVSGGRGRLSLRRLRALPRHQVSCLALLMLSRLGIPVYYAGLHVLIVAYAFLSMGVLRRLLQVRSVPVLLLLPADAGMLSYEHTVEYSKSLASGYKSSRFNWI